MLIITALCQHEAIKSVRCHCERKSEAAPTIQAPIFSLQQKSIKLERIIALYAVSKIVFQRLLSTTSIWRQSDVSHLHSSASSSPSTFSDGGDQMARHWNNAATYGTHQCAAIIRSRPLFFLHVRPTPLTLEEAKTKTLRKGTREWGLSPPLAIFSLELMVGDHSRVPSVWYGVEADDNKMIKICLADFAPELLFEISRVVLQSAGKLLRCCYDLG